MNETIQALPLIIAFAFYGSLQGVAMQEHKTSSVMRADSAGNFVRVSKSDPHYFELSNGELFVPVGVNICWPRFVSREDSVLSKMESYLNKLGRNGGNFTRIWLSAPAFEVEHAKAGEYDEKIARRIDKIVEMARRNGVRIKFCLENFRKLTKLPPAFPGSVPFEKPVYDQSQGTGLTSVSDFFTTKEGNDFYLSRIKFLAKRYASDTVVFGWELWNEVNAVQAEKDVLAAWTLKMLSEVKVLVPHQLVMQSLGSFDTQNAAELYRNYSVMEGNQIAQVHRYLDPGARLDVVKGPMDRLAYDAVSTLAGFNLKKPIVLSEVGAVEAHHAGPSRLYEKDSVGMLLHDYLFAAFFAGAAGPGQSWHWDFYIDKHNLWYHLSRFNTALKGIDPRSEHFKPFVLEQNGLTVYGLKGQKNVLLWCRDKSNTWQSELIDHVKPSVLSGLSVQLPFTAEGRKATFYDPWKNATQVLSARRDSISLPDFKRSCLVTLVVDE